MPNEHTTEPRLRELHGVASLSLRKAVETEPDSWWQHFVFGVMKRDAALRFIEIHNKHHLKIIADILAKG